MTLETVIVRAFRGKPLKFVVLEANETRAIVANPASLRSIASGEAFPISLPLTDLFEHSDEAFERLSKEWETAGSTSGESWRRLKHWRRQYA